MLRLDRDLSMLHNNGFLTEQFKIDNRLSSLEMSPSMDAVFDVDRLNAIFRSELRLYLENRP